MTQFTQPTFQRSSSNPSFMNFEQVSENELLATLESIMPSECVLLKADGAILIITEESVMASYDNYEGKAGLRRVATGGKGKSGNNRPICEVTMSNDLKGALWGTFNINIPVDPVPDLDQDSDSEEL